MPGRATDDFFERVTEAELITEPEGCGYLSDALLLAQKQLGLSDPQAFEVRRKRYAHFGLEQLRAIFLGISQMISQTLERNSEMQVGNHVVMNLSLQPVYPG